MSTENMGGYIAAEILFYDDVKVATPLSDDTIYVQPKDGCSWYKANATPGSINISCESEHTTSGTLYNFEGGLRIALPHVNQRLLNRLEFEPFLLKYTDAHGVAKVAGTKSSMLTATIVEEGDSASSFRGYAIGLMGRLLCKPLTLSTAIASPL